MDKRGQVALFVIIAVVIVGLVAAFFAFRDQLGLTSLPSEVQPVFSYYTTCIDDALRAGAELAGSQGGRIDSGVYVPGSDYAPFSSHLFFAGSQIPYWFSLTSNGLVSENVPSRTELEDEFAEFVAQRLALCDFTSFRQQGFDVAVGGTPRVDVSLEDSSINARVSSTLSVGLGEVRGTRTMHDVQVASELGSLYSEAVSLYNDQQTNAYFDTYAADVLRLYAPVDGVSVQCAPQMWETRHVVDDLQTALEANLPHIRFSTVPAASSSEQYFTIPHTVASDARVLYSRSWPAVIEVSPADDALMIAEPVGNQQGLGMLGFCYVPYHFVYDVRFPVLVQLVRGEEIFQFPVVVIVDDNAPRNALTTGIAPESSISDICSFKSTNVSIATYDAHLNPVEADVFYQCFDQRCSLGKTHIRGTTASLDAALPACANGQLVARADNFTESRQLFSSNSQTAADLVLEKLHHVRVAVFVDGQPTQDTAIVHFTRSDGNVMSALLPTQPSVSLNEGLYNVSVFVYGNSSIVLPSTVRQQCTSVPRAGLAGFLGRTEEQCFEVTSPETRIDSALRGGGATSEVYILESELESGVINVYVNGLPSPTSLEQLQTNFELFSAATAEVGFA